MTWAPRYDAVVLAGGEARRLGGVSKAEVLVAGRPMLDWVLAAAGDAERVVVVGADRLARPGVETVLEDPPLGGPAAGLEAGLRRLGFEGDVPVLVLACDVPLARYAVPALLGALEAGPAGDGAQLLDDDGRPQPLVAVYRRQALVRALERRRAAGGVRGASMRRLLEGMELVGVPDAHGGSRDGDTWEAVAHLETALAGRSTMTQDIPGASPHQRVGSDLHRWVALLVEELAVDPGVVDIDALLDLARDVAHGVARPAVPLTTFLIGYAVAARSADRATFEQVADRVMALAQGWAEQRPDGERA